MRVRLLSLIHILGKNLFDCHNPQSQAKIRELLETGGVNAYTIEKNGVKKMIYQSMEPLEYRMKYIMPKGFHDGFSGNTNYYDSFRDCLEDVYKRQGSPCTCWTCSCRA